MHVSKSLVGCFNFDTGLDTPTSGDPNCQMWETKLSRLSCFATYPFFWGEQSQSSPSISLRGPRRSLQISWNYVPSPFTTGWNCMWKIQMWKKTIGLPRSAYFKSGSSSPQSELPTMSPFSTDNLTSQLPKIKDFATKLSHTTRSPISISHTASSCCWAHV